MNEYKPAYGMTLLWMWIVMTLVVLPFALVGDVVAADHVGAGKGDKVLLVTGTVASKFCMEAPVDAAVVAIIDPEQK